MYTLNTHTHTHRMHACAFIELHAYTNLCMYAHTCVRTLPVHTRVCTHTIYMCIYVVNMHLCVHTSTSEGYVRMHTCMYAHRYTHSGCASSARLGWIVVLEVLRLRSLICLAQAALNLQHGCFYKFGFLFVRVLITKALLFEFSMRAADFGNFHICLLFWSSSTEKAL